ncbi:MAG: hypothetical protein HYX51_09810 [Chloroflexi bacterium]|nr:hypothetical protein [Chloroflexota bacterium]
MYDGADPSAPGRARVEPAAGLAPLLAWVLSHGHGPRVARARDVTPTDQITAMVVSLLVAGRAIPVAWRLLAGHQPGAGAAPAAPRRWGRGRRRDGDERVAHEQRLQRPGAGAAGDPRAHAGGPGCSARSGSGWAGASGCGRTGGWPGRAMPG